MARLIDADAIKYRTISHGGWGQPERVVHDYTIDKMPTVDAVEVVHARWAHLGGDEWCCTACGEVIHTEGSWEKPDKKYCYECGAKMDGDRDG